ncbi:MAG: hypothetical protein IJI25_08800 [Eubacterium sp.]|nr:hypothetical protein [Eubacterium sp.]
MNKIIGLVLSIMAVYLFGRSNMSMDAYCIGVCILIAGFMAGGDDHNHKNRRRKTGGGA